MGSQNRGFRIFYRIADYMIGIGIGMQIYRYFGEPSMYAYIVIMFILLAILIYEAGRIIKSILSYMLNKNNSNE